MDNMINDNGVDANCLMSQLAVLFVSGVFLSDIYAATSSILWTVCAVLGIFAFRTAVMFVLIARFVLQNLDLYADGHKHNIIREIENCIMVSVNQIAAMAMLMLSIIMTFL